MLSSHRNLLISIQIHQILFRNKTPNRSNQLTTPPSPSASHRDVTSDNHWPHTASSCDDGTLHEHPAPSTFASLPARMAPNLETIVVDLTNTADPLSIGLQSALWPARFRMPEVTKYAGNTDPVEFVRVYETAVAAVGGSDSIMGYG